MTDLQLGVLDQVPIRSGGTAAEALAQSVELARQVDQLGYHRYWIAEHHASGALSCASPEILVPRLAAVSQHLRVGTGGVMLSHYSPLKVAENFRLLEAMFPGRIDLGLGRAPGSDGLTAAALSGGGGSPGERFAHQVRDLLGYLGDGLPAGHPFERVRALPEVTSPPEVWLLGSSGGSAELAAYFGCRYCHAHFIAPRETAAALFTYRNNFEGGDVAAPHVALGVSALVAATDEEAARLSMSRFMWWIRLTAGRPGPFPSPETALREARELDQGARATLEALKARSIHGSPESVARRLEELAAEHGAEEVIVLTITYAFEDRLRSYRLLAEAMGLEAQVTGKEGGSR